MNPIPKRLLLLFVASVVVIGVGEIAIRVLGVAPMVRPIVLHSKDAVYKRSTNPLLAYELKAGYRNDHAAPATGYKRTNAHGLRDIERTHPRKPGVRRIILLGDSVVTGQTLPSIHHTISRQLEMLYPDGRTEVLNFGIDGYNTLSEVELLRVKGLAFKPDLVIVLFVLNDFNNFTHEAWRIDSHRAIPKPVQSLVMRSHLFRMSAIRFNWYQIGVMADPVGWHLEAMGTDNVARGLATLHAMAQAHGFGVLIAAWPQFYSTGMVDKPMMPNGDELIIERLAGMYGFPCVRLSTYIEKHRIATGVVNPAHTYTQGDGMHTTLKGSKVAALALRDVLADWDPSGLALGPASSDPEAVTAAAGAVRGTPDSVAILLILGEEHILKKDYETARRYLDLALELDPDNASIHEMLGYVLRFQGDAEGTIRQFKRVIQLTPDDPRVHNLFGEFLFLLQEQQDAQAAFLRAIELNPDNPLYHVNLGRTEQSIGRHDLAERSFHRALTINPNFAQAHNHLGVLYGQAGQTEPALRHLERAVQLDSVYIAALYNLGQVHERAGDHERARQLFQHAAQIDPTDVLVQAGLRRLNAPSRQ